jgi:NADH dehydrogenase [ubiquinone] 1 alpha subcomplex assembly factor 7
MTALGERIRQLIVQTGPMPVSRYMGICLADPNHGYYMRGDPFGRGGDFVTAPEVSQMFGEIIGVWCLEVWRRMGSPSTFHLVELGPGRGTLMADLMRAAAIRPEFLAACNGHLVETSPALRKIQRRTLDGAQVNFSWHDSHETVPPGPALFLANEFFDALPIEQFIAGDGKWHHRLVGLGPNGDLVFMRGPAVSAELSPVSRPPANDGSVLEACPAATAIMDAIAARLRIAGAALIIDYGYDGPSLGDTFQAVADHQPVDPLDTPGRADLTAHVDFSALKRSARTHDVVVHGPLTQRLFLTEMGILERAGRLGSGQSAAVRDGIRADVCRLAGADQMGELFKVMAVGHRRLELPPFDTLA